MEFNISIKKTLKFFVTIIILLTLLSVLGQLYKFEINAGNDRYIVKMIHLDSEMNFPTLYATLTLFLCSSLIFLISISKKQSMDKYFIHWFVLGLIFFFMGMDEILMLHEQLSAPVRGTLNTESILYFSWLIPAAVFLVVFLFAYLKFFFSLDKYFKKLFLFSGILYVFGAAGMEVIGSRVVVGYGQNNLFYALITNIEELFEMIGILFFIFTLLFYIKLNINNLLVKITD